MGENETPYDIKIDETRFTFDKRCHKCHGQGHNGRNLVTREIIPCKCLKLREADMENPVVKAPDLIKIVKELFGGNKVGTKKPDEKKPAK